MVFIVYMYVCMYRMYVCILFRSTAVLVHNARALADTTIGLANVVKTALFQPRESQNGVLGYTA